MKLHGCGLAFGLALMTAACSGATPETHVRKAEGYAAQRRYAEAAIEYRAALQLNPRLGEVRLHLADVYARMNDATNAMREYVRAADLLPGDSNAQVKAGDILLLARSFDDAKARADRALSIDPKNVDAVILRGNALAGLKSFDAAIAEYEDAISRDPSKNDAYISMGTIQAASGKPDEAEATFKKGIAVAPRSVTARLALANFYWAAGRRSDTESTLKAAVALDPSNETADRALGVFYVASGRALEAEPLFKAIADTAKTVTAKLTMAQYYVGIGRRDDARRILADLIKDPAAYAVASVRLASLDYVEGHRVEAQVRVREVLQKFPKDTPANLLSALLLFDAGKRDEALAIATTTTAADPTVAGGHLLAGRIYAATDRYQDAITEYTQALQLEPRSVDTVLELARLSFMNGLADKSFAYTQQAIALQPQNAAAYEMLVRNYLRRKDVDSAKRVLAPLQKSLPSQPRTFDLIALVQTAQNQASAARSSYERALEIDPKDLEALEGLTRLDVAAGRAKDATARLEAALKRGQPAGDLLILAARASVSAGDLARSEQLLLQAVELDPARLNGYQLLAQLYAKQDRTDEAKDRLREAIRRDPRSVSAGTMLAVLLQGQGRVAEAQQEYERVLTIDGRAAVAANNLAWLYAASQQNLDQALQLAQTARALLPDDPHVSDTLGWIYVRKNLASLGIPHLQASVDKAPSDAGFQYHLGMAYLQTGDTERAKRALAKALELRADFEGAAAARKALTDIGA